MDLLQTCSGQDYFHKVKGRTWGICLEEYRLCPWWRLKDRSGVRNLTYSTFEKAEKKRRDCEQKLAPFAVELAALSGNALADQIDTILYGP